MAINTAYGMCLADFVAMRDCLLARVANSFSRRGYVRWITILAVVFTVLVGILFGIGVFTFGYGDPPGINGSVLSDVPSGVLSSSA